MIFAYHGYPFLIHRLTYNRSNHENFHVHGFVEEGTTTTPFDMVVLNNTDRYRLALAAVERIPHLANNYATFPSFVEAKVALHRDYIEQNGIDLPEILDWTWQAADVPDALWTRTLIELPFPTTDYSEV